jgi:hypothetical protein
MYGLPSAFRALPPHICGKKECQETPTKYHSCRDLGTLEIFPNNGTEHGLQTNASKI